MLPPRWRLRRRDCRDHGQGRPDQRGILSPLRVQGALVREAVASALADQQHRLNEDQRKGLDFEGAIRRYLNRAHLKDPAGGCPSAALLPEIARQALPTRQTYEQGLRSYVSTLAALLPDAGSGNEWPPRDGHLRPHGGNPPARASRARRCSGGADTGKWRRGCAASGGNAVSAVRLYPFVGSAQRTKRLNRPCQRFRERDSDGALRPQGSMVVICQRRCVRFGSFASDS